MSEHLPSRTPQRPRRGLARAALALLLLTAACDDTRDSPSAPSSQAPATSAVDAVTRYDQPATDPELTQRIQRIAQTCQLTETGGLQCKDPAPRLELAKQFNTGTRDRIAALPTLVALLASGDPVTSVVVAELLAIGFAHGLGDGVKHGDVSSEVTDGLIEAYRRFDEYRAHRIVPATTHAAVLSGDARKLHEAMVARKDLQGIYRMVRRLMVHGRLSMLDKVRAALDSDDLALSLAGMESMRYMRNWTAEEQATLCPLVLEHMSGPPGPLSVRSAQTYLHCHGPHLSPLLGAMGERLAAGQLQGPELVAFYGRCREPEAANADAARDAVERSDCEQVVAFLESIAKNRKHAEALRASAVSNLAAQLPTAGSIPDDFDRALARRIERRFAGDRSAAIAAAARNVANAIAPAKR